MKQIILHIHCDRHLKVIKNKMHAHADDVSLLGHRSSNLSKFLLYENENAENQFFLNK